MTLTALQKEATEMELLERHVETRNRVNAKSIEVGQRLGEILKEYEGAKIVKVTPYRSWVKKIADQASALQDELQEQGFQLVFAFSDYSVWATLDTTFPVSDVSVQYVKAEMYVCSVSDCCLTVFRGEFPAPRTDYTAEEVVETRSRISALERQIRELKDQIRHFA
jgi:polyhydroxyalkanoate synthesis regulator phasin